MPFDPNPAVEQGAFAKGNISFDLPDVHPKFLPAPDVRPSTPERNACAVVTKHEAKKIKEEQLMTAVDKTTDANHHSLATKHVYPKTPPQRQRLMDGLEHHNVFKETRAETKAAAEENMTLQRRSHVTHGHGEVMPWERREVGVVGKSTFFKHRLATLETKKQAQYNKALQCTDNVTPVVLPEPTSLPRDKLKRLQPIQAPKRMPVMPWERASVPMPPLPKHIERDSAASFMLANKELALRSSVSLRSTSPAAYGRRPEPKWGAVYGSRVQQRGILAPL